MTADTNIPLWHRAIMSASGTVQDAIKSLEKSSLQIVLVCDESGVLHGTITDGDIRRAILRGVSLERPSSEVINPDPITVSPDVKREAVLQMMNEKVLRQIPVVDARGELVDLHLWDHMVTNDPIENIMLIMAGGRGTRLGHHTRKCPKPMLEVGGKPMLELIIERAHARGLRKFVISLNYLGHMIEDYFGDGHNFGVEINYLKEDQPMGTAGSLSLLSPHPTMPFLVTNGDVISDINYDEILAFHAEHKAMGTMAVRHHEVKNQFGVVLTEGDTIKGFEEKPIYRSIINAGVYAFAPTVIELLGKKEHCDMPALFERIISRGERAIVYPLHETWLDVGRPEDLLAAQKLLA